MQPYVVQNARARTALGFAVCAVASALLVPVGLLEHLAYNKHRAHLPTLTSDNLFNMTQVWTITLRFRADQWEAMQPRGGPRGSRPMGPVGHPHGVPPQPDSEGFGPGMAIAPVFIKWGDSNKDARLSKREFAQLSKQWFVEWDTNRSGTLTLEKVRDGINTVMSAPGMLGAGGARGLQEGLMLRGARPGRNGVAAAMGIEFPTVEADLKFNGLEFPAVTVRFKGNGTFIESQNTGKISLKVDLNDNVRGRRLAGVSKLNLHNNITDASWMNEVLAHRLFRDAGVAAPRTAYARVNLEVVGHDGARYIGLYSIVENVDRDFLQDRFGTRSGAIFKPVTSRPFTDMGDDWSLYEQVYDPKTPLSKAEAARVISFCKLVSHGDDAEFEMRLPEFLDLDQFARFMAVTAFLSNFDSILMVGQNYYVYLSSGTGKFVFIPWDLDHSFGQYPLAASQEERENLDIHRPWRGENPFLERVFKVRMFKELYLGYLKEFNNTIFRPERFHEQVNELARVLRPHVRDESEEKLARFDRVVAGECIQRVLLGRLPQRLGSPETTFTPQLATNVHLPVPASASQTEGGKRPDFLFGVGPATPGQRGGPMPFGFDDQIKPIKPFVIARTRSIADQLAGKIPGAKGALGIRNPGGAMRPGRVGGRTDFKPPPGFGPGMVFGPVLFGSLDKDKNGVVDRGEFGPSWEKWFGAWDVNGDGELTEQEIGRGVNNLFRSIGARPATPVGVFGEPGQGVIFPQVPGR
ncbi:MAG: CotH kinase family protein [Verrucomicrobiae bacterium]|nr:CotH kinase family protein [Verrucomicrobiae bacterium]